MMRELSRGPLKRAADEHSRTGMSPVGPVSASKVRSGAQASLGVLMSTQDHAHGRPCLQIWAASAWTGTWRTERQCSRGRVQASIVLHFGFGCQLACELQHRA